MKTTIGLVDDHQLFVKSLGLMLESFGEYEIILEALNGKDLQDKIALSPKKPDMMIVDVYMPVMDGVDTCRWINEQYPTIQMIALSMDDKDRAIIDMLKAGCCAYLLKGIHPTELEKALKEVKTKGFYNADSTNLKFRRLLQTAENPEIVLSSQELKFLPLACSELTYKQIALQMHLSERTIDGYRESLFQKFHVQSRVGLCLEAIRKGYFSL